MAAATLRNISGRLWAARRGGGGDQVRSPVPRKSRTCPGRCAGASWTDVDISLQSLGTDYIDLYYQHRPDPEAPVEEALRGSGASSWTRARSAMPAAPTTTPLNWTRRRQRHKRRARPGSWPARSTGTCSVARSRAKSFRLHAGADGRGPLFPAGGGAPYRQVLAAIDRSRWAPDWPPWSVTAGWPRRRTSPTSAN